MLSKEQVENFNQIIAESNKKLLTLKVLSNFFNHPALIAISIRTQVIHNLFETNVNLDINKLELFHIQYTNSLIELFQKLKKAKEQKYLLISDEIYINEGFINKLKEELSGSKFYEELKLHSQLMCKKLEEIYNLLANNNSGKFSWSEVLDFAAQKASEFYREIPEEQFKQITFSNNKSTYQNDFVVLEKKLAGKLNIQKFKIKMVCGLRYENEFLEVYEFINSNDKFVFINNKKTLYLLDDTQIRGFDFSRNESNKKQLIDQLLNKNSVLSEQLGTIKMSLSNDIEKVLEGYLTKISGVDFLDDLQNVDEQTNILKAMLNINIK